MSNAPRRRGQRPGRNLEPPVREVLFRMQVLRGRPWSREKRQGLVRLSCLHDVVVEMRRGRFPSRATCHLCRALERECEIGPPPPGFVRFDCHDFPKDAADRVARALAGAAFTAPGDPRLTTAQLRDGVERVLRPVLEPLVSLARDVVVPECGSIDFLAGPGLAIEARADGTPEWALARLRAVASVPAVRRVCLVSPVLGMAALPATLDGKPLSVVLVNTGAEAATHEGR